MKLLAHQTPPIVAGESAVAGLAALLLAMQEPYARAALGLGPDSRVLLFGTEGATDPEVYDKLVKG
jgi:diaminopropionate ammonia-lyase